MQPYHWNSLLTRDEESFCFDEHDLGSGAGSSGPGVAISIGPGNGDIYRIGVINEIFEYDYIIIRDCADPDIVETGTLQTAAFSFFLQGEGDPQTDTVLEGHKSRARSVRRWKGQQRSGV